MNSLDLDPNFLLPLWQAVVSFYSNQPPLVHAYGHEPRPISGDTPSLGQVRLPSCCAHGPGRTSLCARLKLALLAPAESRG
ncbi:MAG: hypothetical protein ACHQAZ_08125, partial [Gammaproteobacteria bacterium]